MTDDSLHHAVPHAQTDVTSKYRTPSRAPDVPALLTYFHREPDGFVSFHHKIGDRFEDIGSVSVKALRGHSDQAWIPELLAALTVDGYVSINAFFRPGHRTRTREVWKTPPLNDPLWGNVALDFPDATVPVSETYLEHFQPNGLRYANRNATDLRWITSCWVDCDAYTVGLDAPAAIAGIVRAYRAGEIPVPSLIIGSGRGAWPVWMIVDERNPAEGSALLHHAWHTSETPCRASSVAAALHQQVNTALAARLEHLGADAQAGDLARVCRVPGSLNSKADAIVEVLPVLVHGESTPTAYTLTQLAEFLELRTPAALTRRRSSGTLSAAQLTQRVNAQQARDRKVFTALQALSDLRDGIAQGCRNIALHWFVQAGALSGLDAHTLTAAAKKFGAACRPPLQEREIRAAMGSGRKRAQCILTPQEGAERARRVRYDTLAARLNITAAERDDIGLRAEVPAPPSTKRATVDATIRRLVARLSAVPSQPEMSAHLQALGLKASQQTVGRAYARLGLGSTRTGGRPPRPTLF